MRRPLRYRLLTVAILGVFTAALSGAALYRAIATTHAQRIERGREAVADEVARLQAVGLEALAGPSTVVGLRGGLATSADQVLAGVPADWRAPIADLLARGAATGGRASVEAPLSGAHLVARIEPSRGAQLAWAAIAVKPSATLQSWRMLVFALTISALLLVGNALYALVTVEGHLVEARQIQERLGRELARQERLAALGRVVAGVAHEVRNPLASIKLRLDLAMTAAPNDAIAHASAEITRLDRLVADLLTVSGRPLGPLRPVNVAALLRERVEALSPWAELRRVAIRAAGEGVATADADALGRALDNLLRNAVEASPEGGVVETVTVADGAHVIVAVEDRGTGVPAPRASELFEPFFTTKPDGTGLGLAMSRAIARAHGGDVVYARAGVVTRFELTIPAAAGAETAAAAAGARAGGGAA